MTGGDILFTIQKLGNDCQGGQVAVANGKWEKAEIANCPIAGVFSDQAALQRP